jgi:hypothetical protein
MEIQVARSRKAPHVSSGENEATDQKLCERRGNDTHEGVKERGAEIPEAETRRSRSPQDRQEEPVKVGRSMTPPKPTEKGEDMGTQNTVRRFFRVAEHMSAPKERKSEHQGGMEFVPHHERTPKRCHSTE